MRGPLLLLLAALAWSGPARAQHDHGPPGGPILGTVHFPVSCTQAAQAGFDRAMLLQHSFAHREATAAFRAVLAADPRCAMAWWGQALAALDNLFQSSPAASLTEAAGLLARGSALGTATPREAAYLAALAALVRQDDGLDRPRRLRSYAEAMRRIAADWPDDPEAPVFFALALIMAADPADLGFARQRQAAAILEPIWLRQPDHPGVAHYLIHAYDEPPLAAEGLPAARRYAGIAPAAAHAQHMPSHIFTRLGEWALSVESNTRSAAVARAEGGANNELHARDYLVYAELQRGRTLAARAALAAAAAVRPDTRFIGGPFAVAAMPARLALEPGDWAAAAALPVTASAFPQADALTRYARAIGLARSGQAAAVAAEAAALGALAARLRAGGDAYWTEQVAMQQQAAEALALLAAGETEPGLAGLRAAAAREAVTLKNAVTPGPLAPIPELLGEALLAAGRLPEARAAFEECLKTEPRRFRSVFGLARAAELMGEAEPARLGYSALLEIAPAPDQDRPELALARAFLGSAR